MVFVDLETEVNYMGNQLIMPMRWSPVKTLLSLPRWQYFTPHIDVVAHQCRESEAVHD